ncbi:MAG: thioredoxin family protein [Sphingobacteriales bacterium]|nr:MAG: thioredoxin family protein [Sphingobacteriales bacterium]
MMSKKWFVFASFCLFVTMQSFVLKSDKSVRFRQAAWNEIGKDAKAESKMIFVMVIADYCGVCKKMQNVLADESVGSFYNQNFINTAFDVENPMQQFRASNWGVTGVPAMVFLDQKKNVVYKIQGYKNPEAMLKAAKTALAKR